ncbi:MAG: hypothetical protein ACRDCB_11195 [Clostridium sp.]
MKRWGRYLILILSIAVIFSLVNLYKVRNQNKELVKCVSYDIKNNIKILLEYYKNDNTLKDLRYALKDKLYYLYNEDIINNIDFGAFISNLENLNPIEIKLKEKQEFINKHYINGIRDDNLSILLDDFNKLIYENI